MSFIFQNNFQHYLQFTRLVEYAIKFLSFQSVYILFARLRIIAVIV